MLSTKILKILRKNQNKLSGSYSRCSIKYFSTAKNEFEQNNLQQSGDKFDSLDENLNDITSSVPDFEEAIEQQTNFKKKVERMRDVSRFSKINALKKHRSELPVLSSLQEHYLERDKFYRKLYSRLGKKSGIEPGIAWPHKNELENIINEEKEYDLTLEQKIGILIERKKKAFEDSSKLVKDTDDSIQKMPKQIEGYFQRIVKKHKADEQKSNQKREILDQAREVYGYEVDLRDSRIQEMVKKISEEKKAAEKAKKKEEEKKKVSTTSLQQKLNESQKVLKQQNKPEDEK